MNMPLYRKVLEDRGLTTQDVAVALKVNPSTLYRKLKRGGAGFTVAQVESFREFAHLTGAETGEIFFDGKLAETLERTSG